MLTYFQIAVSGILIVLILLQQKGGGLSSAFGGTSFEYSSRRGAEKVIFYATIVMAVLFVGISIVRLLI